MQYQLALISHELESTQIHLRAIDGYVNATAMCKAAGKDFYDYRRIGPTKEFLAELSAVTGLPGTELVISVSGGTPQLQGTWVHPDVAVNLGQWCSPKFAVAVARWVREWMSGKTKAALPYHLRRYLANRGKIPATHFSILNEMILNLIAPLEDDGYILPENMLPDISEGKMFCRWLREEKNIRTDQMPTYQHDFEDGRIVPARLYPIALFPDFRVHFTEIWMPKRSIAYFEERDPKALPHLKKMLALTQGIPVIGVKSAFAEMKRIIKNQPPTLL